MKDTHLRNMCGKYCYAYKVSAFPSYRKVKVEHPSSEQSFFLES